MFNRPAMIRKQIRSYETNVFLREEMQGAWNLMISKNLENKSGNFLKISQNHKIL